MMSVPFSIYRENRAVAGRAPEENRVILGRRYREPRLVRQPRHFYSRPHEIRKQLDKNTGWLVTGGTSGKGVISGRKKKSEIWI